MEVFWRAQQKEKKKQKLADAFRREVRANEFGDQRLFKRKMVLWSWKKESSITIANSDDNNLLA